MSTAGGAPQPAAADSLMNEIRTFGRLPRKVSGATKEDKAERQLAKRLGYAKAHGQFSAEQLQELDSMSNAGGAPQPAAADSLMNEIRSLGRLPLRVRGQEAHKRAERNLAARFIEAKGKGIFTREQLQELDSLGDAGGASQPADELMQEIRSFGRLPRRVRGDAEAQQSERDLAQRMTNAQKKKRFSEAQLAELSTFAAGCRHVA